MTGKPTVGKPIAGKPPPARSSGRLLTRLSVMMFLQYFVQGCYLPIAALVRRAGPRFHGPREGRLHRGLGRGADPGAVRDRPAGGPGVFDRTRDGVLPFGGRRLDAGLVLPDGLLAGDRPGNGLFGHVRADDDALQFAGVSASAEQRNGVPLDSSLRHFGVHRPRVPDRAVLPAADSRARNWRKPVASASPCPASSAS